MLSGEKMRYDLFLGVKSSTAARQVEIPVIGSLVAHKATGEGLADALPVRTKSCR